MLSRWIPLGLCAALGALWTVRQDPPASAATVSASDDACAECHAAIATSWAGTGMARALRPLDGIDFAGLASVRAGATGWRYRLEGAGAKARIVEDWVGPDGVLSADVHNEARLAFAIGAGVLDTSFAAERGGMLWFAPLELLSAHGGKPRRAALAPGHMQVGDLRLRGPITEECLACHTDRSLPRGFPLNRAPGPDWTPAGISCAACHSAGAQHVAWREQELAGAKPAGNDPVLDPGRLAPLERVSLCARCHLQGDARIYLKSFERGLLPPGGDLLEHMAVYVAAEETDDIGFVSQVERMVRSRCFTRSLDRGARALTCETCHDPHRPLEDERERAAARSGCMKCHAAGIEPEPGKDAPCALDFAARGAQDCVACHMRLTPPFDVAGVEIHDHFVRREKVAPSRFAAIRTKQAADGPLARFAWPGAKERAPDDPGLVMIAWIAANQPRKALELVDVKPSASTAALAAYHHLRGSLLESAGRWAQACEAYERALALEPGTPETRLNLGLVLSRAERAAEGLALLDELVREYPRAEGALRNRALVKLSLRDVDGFRADLEAAQSILPRAENARALASWWRQKGDAAAAAHWTAVSRGLDPAQAK